MTERTYVAEADALAPGDRAFVEVDDRTVGVINHEGQYFALENHCPHDGGPVCEGMVLEKLEVSHDLEAGTREESYSGPPTITCPRHGWEYDVTTGRHIGDDSISIRTYQVVEDDGALFVLGPE